MSSLQKDMFKKGRLPTLGSVIEDDDDTSSPSIPSSLMTNSKKTRYVADSWDLYFDRMTHVQINSDTFCVYFLDARLEQTDKPLPVFLMHHGAGAGALSFALVAKRIHELLNGQCVVMAMDCRGHGDTISSGELSFNVNRLSDDMVNVVSKLYPNPDPYQFILVGHSMGGSVVVDIAYRQRLSNVMGVVVMDVVEGSALEAIQLMDKFLSTRPTEFQSIEEAIQWSYKSKLVRNLQSAKVSIPPLVKLENDKYRWRTDLHLTKPYWKEWFTDLSDKFLGSPVSKLLMLAGTDRLDKTLTIAQMQGKFQLTVLMDSGHFLQEDSPDTTAATLMDFWSRFSRMVLPKPMDRI
ncbi:Alpha/Beta hydrolase protein [Halteromyces radiatus]|uniref:Alpha/Beta hydrolase protein n=1 Tax=Halteromyces radiatus TaxID=101107 RepID=UPI00221EB87A|nr:Alpha/Beta hydrolase protein [Halteromyces radiatus]KAI8088703.1 Alpha/Beta hydrolase protein [Halteromyces radiatus]